MNYELPDERVFINDINFREFIKPQQHNQEMVIHVNVACTCMMLRAGIFRLAVLPTLSESNC